MDVNNLRKEIDRIDAQVLDLLNRRARASQRIGKIKIRKGQGIYSAEREREVLERLKSLNKGPLTPEAIEAIYREVMSSSISLEKKVRIAYLGPEFTYTHQAALKKFGLSVDYLPCSNISDVFAEVERGRSDYGVVPVENSTEGAVNYTLDMFIDSNLRICAELYLPISHHLISNARSLRSINQIHSKPEALAQCRLWLESNLPGAKLMPASSTSAAAKHVADNPKFKDEIACVASVQAAKAYGLRVLARDIEDVANNTTRFIIIARDEARPTGKDRTSIVFLVKDRIGALHDTLVPFQRAGINLTKIESRPSKRKAWSYYFFVDFEGHHDQPHIERTLKSLERDCTFLKVLGSYPKVDP